MLTMLLMTVASNTATPSVTVPELNRRFPTVQAAVTAIGDQQATVLLAPGRYRECAVQSEGVVTFRAVTPGTVTFDGVACEGKAALVLRGRGAMVDGIIFANIRVDDKNGAGIRVERSNLVVIRSQFRNSEEGILAHNDPIATIRIDQSVFSGLGGCTDMPCSHSIYAGDYGSLVITASRFERGTGGHYVKMRGARVEISGSTFDDQQGQATNFMIDLPNGSTGRIVDNHFIQGTNKDNHTALISIAAEERRHNSTGLVINGNRAWLPPQQDSVFVADWSGDRIALGANTLGVGLSPFERRHH